MMVHQLEQVAKRGEPLAALWASESLIYGRFGYGPASSRAVLSGTNRRLAFLPAVRTSGSVDEVTREEFLAVARGLHESMRPERPGTMVRDQDVWEFAIFDKEFARQRRLGAPLRPALRRRRRRRRVRDVPLQGEVRRGAGGRGADQGGLGRGALRRTPACGATCSTSTSRAPSSCGARPSTSRCATWSPTRARSRPSVTDNLYVRVVDVEAALRARKYAAGVDLVIEVDDPILPANTGRYRLVTDGDPEGSSAEVTRVDAKPDISMGVLELGTHLPRRRPPSRTCTGSVASPSTPPAPWRPPRPPSAGTGRRTARTCSRRPRVPASFRRQ